MEKVYSRALRSPAFLGGLRQAGRRFEEAAERRRFEEVPSPRLLPAELELGEDHRRFGRPCLLPFAPQARQPFAQLPVAGLRVEPPPDHERGSHRAVPVVLLEPKREVERGFLPEAVELAAEAERDRGARISSAVPDPEAQVLSIPHRGDVAELAPGD